MAKAVFIGDSYTSAYSTQLNGTPSWAAMLSGLMGWDPDNLALGGTGYKTANVAFALPQECGQWPYAGGYRCPPFNERIADAAAAATSGADLVIVLGGRNEVHLELSPGGVWAQSVHDFYRDLRAATPARILALSPIWDDDPVPAEIQTMRTVVAGAVAGMRGACYIDLHDPLLGHPERVISDGIHPSTAGQQAIVDAFLAHTAARCIAPAQPIG